MADNTLQPNDPKKEFRLSSEGAANEAPQTPPTLPPDDQLDLSIKETSPDLDATIKDGALEINVPLPYSQAGLLARTRRAARRNLTAAALASALANSSAPRTPPLAPDGLTEIGDSSTLEPEIFLPPRTIETATPVARDVSETTTTTQNQGFMPKAYSSDTNEEQNAGNLMKGDIDTDSYRINTPPISPQAQAIKEIPGTPATPDTLAQQEKLETAAKLQQLRAVNKAAEDADSKGKNEIKEALAELKKDKYGRVITKFRLIRYYLNQLSDLDQKKGDVKKVQVMQKTTRMLVWTGSKAQRASALIETIYVGILGSESVIIPLLLILALPLILIFPDASSRVLRFMAVTKLIGEFLRPARKLDKALTAAVVKEQHKKRLAQIQQGLAVSLRRGR